METYFEVFCKGIKIKHGRISWFCVLGNDGLSQYWNNNLKYQKPVLIQEHIAPITEKFEWRMKMRLKWHIYFIPFDLLKNI